MSFFAAYHGTADSRYLCTKSVIANWGCRLWNDATPGLSQLHNECFILHSHVGGTKVRKCEKLGVGDPQ